MVRTARVRFRITRSSAASWLPPFRGLGSLARARRRTRRDRPSDSETPRSRRGLDPAGNKEGACRSPARADFFYFEAGGGAVSYLGAVHLGGNRRPGRKRAGARGAGLWRSGDARLWGLGFAC